MIIVTITRAAASYHDGYWDLTWEILVLYLESCIAIVMASVVAFRSVFVEKSRRRERTRIQMLSSPDDVEMPRRPENLSGRSRHVRERVKEDVGNEGLTNGRIGYLARTIREESKTKGLWTIIDDHVSQTRNDSFDGSMEDAFQNHSSDTWLETPDDVVYVDLRQV
jgi:hypothetical protein